MVSATELPDMCGSVAYVVRVLGVLNNVWLAQHAALNITVSPDLSKAGHHRADRNTQRSGAPDEPVDGAV